MTTPSAPPTPLVAEDLLLLLFDPRSGTIAGERTLFYTLAGAVLADLTLQGRAEAEQRSRWRDVEVRATGTPPEDPLLRGPWEALAAKPQGAQAFLAGQGPRLRRPLLDRLVATGRLRRARKRMLGLVPVTVLREGARSHRAELLAAVRPVLVDGTPPDPRTAVLAALMSAGGSLPELHRDIPWSGAVYTRGKELEKGNWGASAASEAVIRTTVAVAASSVVTAAVVAGGQ